MPAARQDLRRDPTVVRVLRTYRLHPNTIKRIDQHAKQHGLSAGQVIDHLTRFIDKETDHDR